MFGATGYSGLELVRLLAHHPGVKKPLLFQRNGDSAGFADLSEAYPQLAGNGGFPVEAFSWQRMKDAGVDVVFLATPHEFSREWVPEAIGRGLRVIDLSGAWRLKQAANREVYGFSDANAQDASLLDEAAVYGLPELHAEAIKDAALLANPGCYPTSIILALAPWIRAGYVDVEHGIICDSKSGVSGAGKTPSAKTHFVEVDGDFSAYNVFGHRHTGEMLEQLGLDDGLAAIHAASAADSARHSFHHLREAGQAGIGSRNWSNACASSTPASPGCASSARRACRRSSFRATPISATSDFRCRPMASGRS